MPQDHKRVRRAIKIPHEHGEAPMFKPKPEENQGQTKRNPTRRAHCDDQVGSCESIFTSTPHSQAQRSAVFLEETPRWESLLCMHQK
jgi:hypothetical protein